MAFWKRSTPKIETAKTAVPPQRPSRAGVTPTAAPVVENQSADKAKLTLQESRKPEAAKPETSFDPYNSGAFDRRDTWGKVIRK